MTENEKIILETKARSESNSHRLDEVSVRLEKTEVKVDDIHAFASSIANSIDKMATAFEYMKKDVDGISNTQKDMKIDIIDLKNKPAQEKSKRWDKVIEIVAAMVITGLSAFILGQICPNIFNK